MQSTFQEAGPGRAIIQNATSVGTEQLVVTLHPGTELAVEIEIKEDTGGGDSLVSSAISIKQPGLQKLVQWLREQGAVA
jgi:hypothetical protein